MGRKGRDNTKPDLLRTLSVSFNPHSIRDSLELIDMCIRALHDWRATTCEAAMAAICGALEGFPTLHEVDTRCFILFAMCGVSVKKKGSLKEERLALRAVSLLALTLQSGASWILEESFPVISKKLQEIHVSHDDAPTQVAAIECLVAVTLAGAQDAEDVDRALKATWAVITGSASSSTTTKTSSGPTTKKTRTVLSSQSHALAAAVSAWTFLLTTATDALPRNKAAWAAATVTALAGLLGHDDRAVWMAAGEALALCVELNLTQHTPRKDMEALQARVSELAEEAAGRGANNTLLSEQKHLFRQVAAFLDRNERPRESVTMRTVGDGRVALKVSSWIKLVQLNFLRRFLGNGFLKHTHGNELFKEAFSYGADEGKVLSISRKERRISEEDKLVEVNHNDWMWLCHNVFVARPYQGRDNSEKLLELGWH